MKRSALVLVAALAIGSTSCSVSLLAAVRSAASHERQADDLSARISLAWSEIVDHALLGQCSSAEAEIAKSQLRGARDLVDGSSLGLTTATLGLSRQRAVTGNLRAAARVVEGVEKALRTWELRDVHEPTPTPAP